MHIQRWRVTKTIQRLSALCIKVFIAFGTTEILIWDLWTFIIFLSLSTFCINEIRASGHFRWITDWWFLSYLNTLLLICVLKMTFNPTKWKQLDGGHLLSSKHKIIESKMFWKYVVYRVKLYSHWNKILIL